MFGGLEFLYQFLDFFLALVILPNMIALIALSGEVRDLKNEFFHRRADITCGIRRESTLKK